MIPTIWLACGIAAVGVPDPPPNLDPLAPRDRLVSFQGEVTAVDGRSVTVRGFCIARMRERGSKNKTYRDADGKTWVTAGPHTVLFYAGGVHGTESESVRVIRSEWVTDTLTLFPEGGGVPLIYRIADQPACKFFARGPLAAPDFPAEDLGNNHYRLADIRVGDRVSITGTQRQGVEYAEQVVIDRRPGGRVPPSPHDVAKPPQLNHPWWHEMKDAEQDLEERGIPLPEGYHKFKRWVNVAPMPREAKPKL